jgi:hypothetical protein
LSRKQPTLVHVLTARGGVRKAVRVLQLIILWFAVAELEGLQSMSVDEFVDLGGYYSRTTAFRVQKETLELLPEFASMDEIVVMMREQKAVMLDGTCYMVPGVAS